MAIWPSSSVLTIKSSAQGREMIPLGTISPPPMAHTAGSTQFPANILCLWSQQAAGPENQCLQDPSLLTGW